MDITTKIKLLSITALVAALLGTYLAALQIDSLARAKYAFKRRLFLKIFYSQQKQNHHVRYFYFKQGNSHSVVRKDLRYETNSVSRYQQKVHTRVIDAKLNQKYSFAVNSTLEYIFQYSYTQDVCMKHVLSKITLQLQIILIDTFSAFGKPSLICSSYQPSCFQRKPYSCSCQTTKSSSILATPAFA